MENKNIIKAINALDLPFGEDLLKSKFGRNRDQLTHKDYLVRDEKNRWHLINIDNDHRIGSDTFKSSTYDDSEIDDEFDNSQPMNSTIKKPLKIFNYVQNFVEQKAHKVAKKELINYLKRYFKFDDTRIAKFMRKLNKVTKNLNKNLDKFNLHKKIEEKMSQLLQKHFKINTKTIIKNNLGDVTKFLNKTFNTTFSNLLKTDLFEDLIFDILLF